MKIIDLLNKIAKGEKLNIRFKINGKEIELSHYTDNSFDIKYFDGMRPTLFDIIKYINDEVEILEEEKKIPEKIKDINSDFYVKDCYYEKLSKEEIALDLVSLKNLINSIIDYLKSKGE